VTWQPDYATSAELKHFVRIPDGVGEDSDDDAELGLALTAASRIVDRECNRQFGQDAGSTTRYYTARWDPRRERYIVEIDDLYDNSATVTSDGDAVTGFTYWPINAETNGKPFTMLVFDEGISVSTDDDEIAVTSTKFGWSAVPSAVKNATLLQASRLLKRRDAPFGVAGSVEFGSELRLLAKIDPDVKVLLRPYYRWWGAR
jgi:hypothetical protein